MNDSHIIHRCDVAVVGAGLAGLAAARRVQALGAGVTVLDPHPVGGRGRTDDRGGFLFNRGPHALYLGGEAARVLQLLGVRPTGGPPSAESFGLLGDRIDRLPAGALTLARTRLLGRRGKVAVGRLLAGLPKVRADTLHSTTFADWLTDHHLPADAAALVEAIARVSTYSHAPELVAADMVISQIQLALANGVQYVDGGWQSIADALATGVEIRSLTVSAVHRDGDEVVVETAEGTRVICAAAVVAAGTPAVTAGMLGRAPFDVGPPIEAACLDLGVRSAPSPGFLLGIDRPLYLSDHSPNARLAPAGQRVVHVARYLAPGDDLAPAALRAELEAHAARVGLTEDTVVEQRYLHRMTVSGALPTADRGGLPCRPRVTDSGTAGVFLAGDWVGPDGHLLDAALASADAAAVAAVRLVGR